jgi:hypothetical protein
MAELLYELDSGASCLPPGSEIVFVNAHPPEDTLGSLLRGKTLTNVKVWECLTSSWTPQLSQSHRLVELSEDFPTSP